AAEGRRSRGRARTAVGQREVPMLVIARSMPRRALLAAAAMVALAALVFLGARPLSAGAAPSGTDGDVVLGAGNSTYYTTSITSTNPNGTGLLGTGGYSGVEGFGNSYGVYGSTSTGTGMYGFSDSGTGAVGNTNSGIGVLAESGGTALQ